MSRKLQSITVMGIREAEIVKEELKLRGAKIKKTNVQRVKRPRKVNVVTIFYGVSKERLKHPEVRRRF